MRKKVIDNLDDNHQYVFGIKPRRRKMNKCCKLVFFFVYRYVDLLLGGMGNYL
jgi:hypothetical protein